MLPIPRNLASRPWKPISIWALPQVAAYHKDKGTFWATDAAFQPVTPEQQAAKLFSKEYNVVGCVAPNLFLAPPN